MQSYWIVDPATPSVFLLELGPSGAYHEAATVTGTDVLRSATPFAVELTPAALVAD